MTRIERPLLERFAQDLVGNGTVSVVSKIFDQYLDVIALEPNLFTLNIKDSFTMYNEPSLTEQQIRGFMNRVATGLLSMIRVLGALPVIRAPKGGAAEMLAHELNGLLKENVMSRGPAQALFEVNRPSSQQCPCADHLLQDCLVHDRSRPLMIVVDRVSDLFPVLQHTSTYQVRCCELIGSLVDRLYHRLWSAICWTSSSIASQWKPTTKVYPSMQLLSLPNPRGSAPGSNKKKTYDLNTQTDSFLARYAGSPFPEAVDANERELSEVSQRETAIRSRPDFGNADPSSASLEGKGKDLSEAIESLPEILSKKTQLEAHTNVMQAVMRCIASREIPTYFETEQGMLTAGARAIDRPAVLALLKDSTKGLLQDKARLLMLLAALGDPTSLSKVGAEEYDTAFTQGCAGMVNPPSTDAVNRALEAVRFLRKLMSLQSGTSMLRSGATGAGQGALLSNFLGAAQNRASSLITKATSFFSKFIPFYVSRVVDSLTEGRDDESFCFLDPRSPSAVPAGYKHTDVIVFVVGGGSYSEYFNLQEYLKDKTASGSSGLRNIIYGCSDLVSGDDFLAQVERLANTAVVPVSK